MEIQRYGTNSLPWTGTRKVKLDSTMKLTINPPWSRFSNMSYKNVYKIVHALKFINKNMRICADCHDVIRLIAKLENRTIRVADKNTIHTFSPNGKCSCNEFF